MDSTILAAWIGAVATVLAAIVGGIFGRSETVTRFLTRSRIPSLADTKWESTWIEMHNGQEVQKKAVLEFIEQKHERVYGTITMDGVRNIKWKVEGDYNGRFLRLLWHPDSKASNRFVVDLGCYFYEQQGDGSFAGYGVGFESEINRIEVGKDILRQLS